MAYKEKDFQTEFIKWARHFISDSAAFELKLARGSSLPFSDLQEHQANALYQAKHIKMIHKIPDDGYQHPFDCFMLAGVPAFIVVQYMTTAKRPKDFFLIDIDRWQDEEKNSTRKSLTLERAEAIGKKFVLA